MVVTYRDYSGMCVPRRKSNIMVFTGFVQEYSYKGSLKGGIV